MFLRSDPKMVLVDTVFPAVQDLKKSETLQIGAACPVRIFQVGQYHIRRKFPSQMKLQISEAALFGAFVRSGKLGVSCFKILHWYVSVFSTIPMLDCSEN